MSVHRHRLTRLERAAAGRAAPGECEPTVIVPWRYGQPRPDPPAGARRCPRCGEVHPRYVVERVIATRREYREAVREMRARERPGCPSAECWAGN